MWRWGIFPVVAIFLLSGCVQDPLIDPTFSNCEDYCKAKNAPICKGKWNITGEYPYCSCGFLCEKKYSCIDDTDCPEGMKCYYSRYCMIVEGGGMRCGEQLGDLICHKECDSDENCTGVYSKCVEMKLWEGDKSRTLNLCMTKEDQNKSSDGTFVKPPDRINLPVRPEDVIFERLGVLPYGVTGFLREGPNTGIDFELEKGAGFYAVADGWVMSISTDSETGDELITIHHNLGQGAFDGIYTGNINSTVKGGEEVFQGEKVGLIDPGALQTTGFLHFEVQDQFTHQPRCPDAFLSKEAHVDLINLIANSTYPQRPQKNQVCN